jgi:hypothetical protein
MFSQSQVELAHHIGENPSDQSVSSVGLTVLDEPSQPEFDLTSLTGHCVSKPDILG